MKLISNIVIIFVFIMRTSFILAGEPGHQENELLKTAAGSNRANSLLKDQTGSSIEKYQEMISALEAEQDIYSQKLVEALLGLGLAYRSEGEYEKAVDTFNKGLILERIHKGLQHPDQIKIINLIIESSLFSKDWHEVDTKYQYLYWVYQRNYNSDKSKILEILNRLGRWYLSAHRLGIDESPLRRLLMADKLYDQAIRISETVADNDHPRIIKALYYSAIVNHHIASQVQDINNFGEMRESMLIYGRQSPYVLEHLAREYYAQRSFIKGETAIKQAVAIYAEDLPSSIVAYAQAIIFLGDWYLVSQRKSKALENYKRAYELLVENKIKGDTINELMGKPKSLKPLTPPNAETDNDIDNDVPYAKLIFDVSNNGWPQNIKVVENNFQDDPQMLRRVHLAIVTTQYRPRFENGKPVETVAVKRRYMFKD